MFAQFDFGVIANSWVYLFQVGMAFTLELTVLSMIGGVALGTLLALGRMSSFKPLALVLSSNCAEARRLAEHVDRLAAQQKDSQRRIDQLNDMVEGLKNIERTLPVRPAASAPQGIIK